MIDNTQVKELLEVLEEVYDVTSEAKDIISGAKVRVKEVKVMMKDWAERNEFSPDNIKKVYDEYSEYREGKAKWGEEDSTDDEFVEILVAIQDRVAEEKRK